ncbi:MAG: transglycosylase SLT domain-containing protein [Desulfobulbaceae bacterium]|nr:transglycosylase SLT domain-containing protein [Desulfobulbaceae bacterium]
MLNKTAENMVLALVVGFLLLLTPQGVRAGEEPFPLYPAIEKNVRFWERVFSEFSLSQAVLHDRDDLGIIYGVVAVQPPNTACASETNRLRLEPVKEEYRQMLLRLAMGEGPSSPEEQRVMDLFGPAPGSDRLLAAADNIRVQIGQKERFKEGLVRSGTWLPEIRKAFEAEGIPADLAYLAHVESSFNPRAQSKVGAVGLWQFMRATGRRFLNIDAARDERLNPIKASRAAARFLRENYKVLGSWPVAITAYNHGQAGMHRAIDAHGDLPGILANYQGKSFGFASRNFYAEFLAVRNLARDSQKYFGPLEVSAAAPVREVVLPKHVSLCRLADYMKLDPALLMECNPDLRKPVKSGSVLIPSGHVLSLPEQVATVGKTAEPLPEKLFSASAPPRAELYRVKSGDTLSGIARKFATSTTVLAEINDLVKPSALRVGQDLRVPVGKEAAVADDKRLAQAEARPAAASVARAL